MREKTDSGEGVQHLQGRRRNVELTAIVCGPLAGQQSSEVCNAWRPTRQALCNLVLLGGLFFPRTHSGADARDHACAAPASRHQQDCLVAKAFGD